MAAPAAYCQRVAAGALVGREGTVRSAASYMARGVHNAGQGFGSQSKQYEPSVFL